MATREQTYKAQLQALGIYDPAFDPLIKELAQKERQRKRAQDEWSEKAKKKAEAEGEDPKKAKPDFGDALWDTIQDLDRMILAYRETMGLTPKSLRRLKGAASADPAQSAAAGISARLDAIAERVSRYGTPSVPKLNTGDTSSGAGAPPSPQGEGSEETQRPADIVPIEVAAAAAAEAVRRAEKAGGND